MARPNQSTNPFIGIAGATGGTLLVMIGLIVIFVPSEAGLIVPVAWAMAVLGILLGFFAYKKK